MTAQPERSTPPTAKSGAASARRRSALVVGLVNNMPDSAFADTESQFAALLANSGSALPVQLRRYAMASVERGEEVRPLLASYLDADEIYADPPDALIVTGTEPRCPDLRDEPYWDELARLLQWSQSSVSSVLLSCLAAHAAVLAVDGLARTPLPDKCLGVFAQDIHHGHSLTSGLRSAAFPHSRYNEVDTVALRGVGYQVLTESRAGGWTVAARQINDTLTVMFQGHPEYNRDTLLREYRRDVRRYLNGERDVFPPMPVGYLDGAGEELLARFRDEATSRDRDASAIDRFPFDDALGHVTADWRGAAARLASNWLAYVDRSRTASGR